MPHQIDRFAEIQPRAPLISTRESAESAHNEAFTPPTLF